MDTYELVVCKFHLDNMCSKEVSAPCDSSGKAGLPLVLSRFSGNPGSPPPTSFSVGGGDGGGSVGACSQGQADGLICLSARVPIPDHGNLKGHLYFNFGTSNRLRHIYASCGSSTGK